MHASLRNRISPGIDPPPRRRAHPRRSFATRMACPTSSRRRNATCCSCRATCKRAIGCSRWTRCAARPTARSAELLGSSALSSDIQLRTIGIRRAAEASVPALSAATRAGLKAYAEGVNAYAMSHPLPPEYQRIEVTRFRPWTDVDSVSIFKLITFQLSFELSELQATLRCARIRRRVRSAASMEPSCFSKMRCASRPSIARPRSRMRCSGP